MVMTAHSQNDATSDYDVGDDHFVAHAAADDDMMTIVCACLSTF